MAEVVNWIGNYEEEKKKSDTTHEAYIKELRECGNAICHEIRRFFFTILFCCFMMAFVVIVSNFLLFAALTK